MIESGSVPENDRIRANTRKGQIRASTKKLSERVPKNGRIRVSPRKRKNPGEYREKVESVRVSKNCAKEYGKKVESGSVPETHRFLATSGNM